MENAKLHVGRTFEIMQKILTIGSIERNINNALEQYKGKKIVLMVSKEIKSLCDRNIDYDAEGFGIEKMQEKPSLKKKQFEIIEMN